MPATFALLCTAVTLPLNATSVAVITSADTIVAAIDSKEVHREYAGDETVATGDQISCKARQAGPFFVLIAGISRATDGFSALETAAASYRNGDSLDDFASRLEQVLPSRLEGILDAVLTSNKREFDKSFRDQDVLQMSLLGADGGRPRAVIVAFRASISESGNVSIRAYRNSCPGDCSDPNTVYLLGMHDEAERFVHAHPEVAGDARTSRALQLIQVEYASHPEVLGGPATAISVTSSSAQMEQFGACAEPSGVQRILTELNSGIAAMENVVVREDVWQHSKRKQNIRSHRIHGVVRVIDGNEEYTWSGQAFAARLPEPRLPEPRLPEPRLPEPRLPEPRLPEPWCGGELATMMRVTRDVLQQGRETLSYDFENETVVLRFHASETDRYWQLLVGGKLYPLAFDGSAWFSQATGKLLRIRWETTQLHLPSRAGIRRVEWDEAFSTSDIAGRPFLVPNSAVYRVNYSSRYDRIDWTETLFSDFHRYGASENVQFEQASLR